MVYLLGNGRPLLRRVPQPARGDLEPCGDQDAGTVMHDSAQFRGVSHTFFVWARSVGFDTSMVLGAVAIRDRRAERWKC